MTQKEGLEKMAKFCAYQERCQSEVKQKLRSFDLTENETENIICDLIEQNFLDEERFSKAFVRGKFNQKRWGKNKIQQHLKQKQISDYCIKKGFAEIDNNKYLEALDEIIAKKTKTIKDTDPFIVKQKLARYAISRGFESELVWEVLN